MTRPARLAIVVAVVALASSTAACAEQEPAEPVACTAEQLTTITAGSGVPVSEELIETGTTDFSPAEALGELPTTCMLTFHASGSNASFAVLPGADETLDAVTANLEDAGAAPDAADGQVTATVGDNTIVAAPLALVTQETAGFEEPDDLVVVVSSPVTR